MVLPFGVSIEKNPKKGFATSAPKNPKIGKKFFITTVLTAFVWGVIHFIMINHWIRFS